MHKTSTFW